MKKSAWIFFGVVIVVVGAFGLAGAQQGGSSLSSLPTEPPVHQTIRYVGKTSTTDFSGLGQHLYYFPAFGYTTPHASLPTDCDDELPDGPGCIEFTRDFEGLEHGQAWEFPDRTFSSDAVNDDDTFGVRTAGGYSSWDSFTLPNGAVGLSGTAYDGHACDSPNNIINQLRINTPDLHEFCLNVIVDNSVDQYRPLKRLEARSDHASFDLSADPAHPDDHDKPGPHPDFILDGVPKFDGSTDMYTFRYTGMKEGDRIKLRIEGEKNDEHDPKECIGAGFGGIMVSHISTCSPPPGCVPDCTGRSFGDDGCGGSCGTYPRPDKLVKRRGTVNLTIAKPNVPIVSIPDDDVETSVFLADSFQSIIDKIDEDFRKDLKQGIRDFIQGEGIGFKVRNYHARVEDHVEIIHHTPTVANGNYQILYKFPRIKANFKLVPKNDPFDLISWKVNILIDHIAVDAVYNSTTGFVGQPHASIGTIVVQAEGNVLSGILDEIGVSDFLQELFMPDFTPTISTIFEGALSLNLGEKITKKIERTVNKRLGIVTVPMFGMMPDQIEFNGVDYGEEIIGAVLDPPLNKEISIVYDASSKVVVPRADGIEEARISRFQFNMWNQYIVLGELREETFPTIAGHIGAPYWNAAGDYAVDGWVCGEKLGRSLDAGLFADGYAITLDRADGPADPEVVQACGTEGTFDRYAFSLAPTSTELGSHTAWEERIGIIAGLDGFEKNIGEVSRTLTEDWMSDVVSPFGFAFNVDSPEKNHVADFNGDGLADYLWEWEGSPQGWIVATSNGLGFNPPRQWLAASQSPSGRVFNPNHLERLFVSDFNGDHKADLMWEDNGWWVALANSSGTAFNAPTQWLPANGAFGPNVHTSNPLKNRVADFNGDGRADFMWEQDGNTDRWIVALAKMTGDGFRSPQSWLSSAASPTGKIFDPAHLDRLFVADFNNDDRADLMWEYGGWYVALSAADGSGFTVSASPWLAHSTAEFGNSFNDDAPKNLIGDFDGDGFTDFMWEREGAGHAAWIIARSSGGWGYFEEPFVGLEAGDSSTGRIFNPNHPDRQFVADMNADFLDDYVFQWDRAWWVAIANGSGFDEPIRWLAKESLAPGVTVFNENHPWRHYVADFDGDVFPDLLWEDGGWRVATTMLPGEPAPPPPPPGGGC